MNFDVLIIGAGPSGLSSSIRLAQLAKKNNKELNIGIVEKGSEVGAHILSGAVLETKALDELIPDWKTKDSPLKTEAKKDNFLLLTRNRSFKLPTPPQMSNEGNYIISLGNLCKWLGKYAERLGVDIYMRGMTGGIRTSTNSKYSVSLYELLKSYSNHIMKKNFLSINIPQLGVCRTEEAIELIKKKIPELKDWKEIYGFIPKKFKTSKVLKKSGVAGFFAASLELTKEGLINIFQKI